VFALLRRRRMRRWEYCDEYLSTGTLADLSGAAGAEGGGGGGGGGAAAAAGGAGAGKAADAERAMAANFLD